MTIHPAIGYDGIIHSVDAGGSPFRSRWFGQQIEFEVTVTSKTEKWYSIFCSFSPGRRCYAD